MSPPPPTGRIYGRSESDPLPSDFEPIASAEEFVRLRESPEREDYLRPVREEVSLAVLRDVIARFPDHRETVVLNKFVPVELLEELCSDEDWSVRNWIAKKRSLPEHLQVRLTADPHDVVRRSLVDNKRATRRCLEALVDDPFEWIREKARKRLADGDFRPAARGG
jgi:hypothetical protein